VNEVFDPLRAVKSDETAADMGIHAASDATSKHERRYDVRVFRLPTARTLTRQVKMLVCEHQRSATSRQHNDRQLREIDYNDTRRPCAIFGNFSRNRPFSRKQQANTQYQRQHGILIGG
jgi:hypothetical protein